MIRKAVCSALVLLAASVSQAVDPAASLPYAATPDQMLSEIGDRGASAVAIEFYNSASWLPVMKHVESGNRDWLLLALAVAPGTDGAATTDLSLSVSKALLSNPEAVLELFLSSDPPRLGVCHGWAEFAGHTSFESAIAEVRAKIAKLDEIEDSSLSVQRDKCLKTLRDSEPTLRKIYGAAPS